MDITLVLHAMNVMNVVMHTLSVVELCYEMHEGNETYVVLCVMSCNVSHGSSCIFVCHLHRDTSLLYHEIKNSIFMCHDIM